MSINKEEKAKLRIVRDYHERTKHRMDRSAASLGYMDWANQPNPFRNFEGAEQIDLPHPDLRETPTYDELFSKIPAAAGLGADLVGRLFFHSLALSAWKQAPQTNPWSLRINPSSGALHPTEGYLICGQIPNLIDRPGVFHYSPFLHCLERRCSLSEQQWDRLAKDLPSPFLLIGLTSIYWRESWKYGERAFRYCNHDVGHAIGAINYSARILGWETRALDEIADADLNRLLGAHLQAGIEAEHADCLLALYPIGADQTKKFSAGFSPDDWSIRIPDAEFTGTPNQLSRDHHDWPIIEDVSLATRNMLPHHNTQQTYTSDQGRISHELIPDRKLSAEQIIRQRRSAVNMNGDTSLDRAVFYQMLARMLPALFPFGASCIKPRVSLAIFVHRISDLASGLYLFVRNESHEASLRDSLSSGFQWKRPEGCPDKLSFYLLKPYDARYAAKEVSCHQDIAGEGAFSIGMLAKFDAALKTETAWIYPRLYWECGIIGQVLYLEAEAAGIRGTGIGCFFDDVMHQILGVVDHTWQSLYHFTVGGPIEDKRIKTIPPYAHIVDDGKSVKE